MRDQRYHPLARYLHWTIAALIVLQFVLAKLAEEAATPVRELALLANHRSVGITIFALAIVRVAWRLRQGVPRPLPMPAWQLTASRLSHWSMYALVFLIPVSGWLMSSASGSNVNWFNLVQLPDLVVADPGLQDSLRAVHVWLAYGLFLVALVHIAAALKHALLERNGAIARMTSTGTLLVFFALLATGIVALTGTGRAGGTQRAGGEVSAAPATSDVRNWDVDYAASYLRFVGTQAGADIEGEWQEWTAEIRFDPENPGASLFEVSVTVAAVETRDDERDRTLLDREWFDVENFPEARYRAGSFRALPDGRFAASGSLMVKDRNSPVVLAFTVTRDGNRQVLHGQAELDRLALQLGTGEWADTRWIGQFVDLVVHVETID